jgi:prepilin-type processing-associated H-X9-DG protein
MYTQDYDETLPLAGWVNLPPAPATPTNSRWPKIIYSYVKNGGVFVCPSQTNERYSGGDTRFVPVVEGTWSASPLPGPNSGGGYGMNWNLVALNGSWGIFPSKTLSEIGDSAGTFLICDTAQMQETINGQTVAGNQFPETWNKFETNATDWQVAPPSVFEPNSAGVVGYYYDTADGNTRKRPTPRHNGGLTVIYCDGHAKWSNIKTFLGTSATTGKVGYDYGHPMNSWDNK